MRSSPRQLRGFTLVELAITILILGMLIAMGIPAIGSLSQSQMLMTNTENLAAQLRMARQRAISIGSGQTMHFTAGYPTASCDYHIHNGLYVVPLGKLATGITYYWGTNTTSSYTMMPDGTCQYVGGGLVILQNPRGMRDTVSIQASGLVLTR